MTTHLVTGGVGFIGNHLCRYLLNKGEKVICVDNLYSGNRDNIEDLIGHSNFTFIHEDIINRNFLETEDLRCVMCYDDGDVQTTAGSVYCDNCKHYSHTPTYQINYMNRSTIQK